VNIELLEIAADALGELLDDVMFVGGATIELWVTRPAPSKSGRRKTSTSWSR
jgi:hypothetical protein